MRKANFPVKNYKIKNNIILLNYSSTIRREMIENIKDLNL